MSLLYLICQPYAPFFSTYQPNYAHNVFNNETASKHFKKIIDNKMLKIQWDENSLISDLNTALNNSSWYEDGRKNILDEYVPFRDGRSTERLVKKIINKI